MSETLSDHSVPQHVAIVMDGNGRWAQAQGLEKIAGHRAGAQAAKNLIPYAQSLGVQVLTLYTFSKENWGREDDEVQGLLSLIASELKDGDAHLQELDVRFKIIGALDDFPADIARGIRELEERSKDRQGMTVVFALSYGARQDMIKSVKAITAKVVSGAIEPSEIDETVIADHLSTSGLPAPELLIRTSGELRLSNFLLWELAYAELYFTTCLWPDFTPEHFTAAIESFGQRQRCFGKSRNV